MLNLKQKFNQGDNIMMVTFKRAINSKLLKKLFIFFNIGSFCFSIENASAQSINDKEPVDYIYRGNFEGVQYDYKRNLHILQENWALYPKSDLTGYRIDKDAEAATPETVLSVNYDHPPKSSEGWKDLCCLITLMGIPQDNTEFRFKCRGKGKIIPIIVEHKSLDETPTVIEKSFKRVEYPAVKLTEKWGEHTFNYPPSRDTLLGKVRLLLRFEPEDGIFNLSLDDVKAVSPVKKQTWLDLAENAKFTIPLLKKTPTIDGQINEDEWFGSIPAGSLTNISQLVPSTSQGVFRIGYTTEGLFIVFKTIDGKKPIAPKREHDTGGWQDDSIEVLLSPSNDLKSLTHFILTASNSIYEEKGGSKEFDPAWTHAVQINEKGWQAELFIPWKELPWNIPADKPFKMNLAHNKCIENKEIKTLITSALSIVKKENNLASFNNIDMYPDFKLEDNNICAGVSLQYSVPDLNPALFLEITNPSSSKQQFICSYFIPEGLVARASGICESGKNLTFKLPSEVFDYKKRGKLFINVTDSKGKIIYSHLELFLTGGIENLITIKKYFPANTIELSAALDRTSGCSMIYKVENSEGKTILRDSRDFEASKEPLIMNISTEKLQKDIPYTLTAEIYSHPDKNLLGCKKFELICPPEEPWVNTKVGISDNPVPPYTPIKVAGTSLKCLLTEYDFKGQVLPSEIRNENHELLSSPIKCTVKSNDKRIDLGAGTVKITSQKPNRIEWTSEVSSGDINASWICWIEEDGFSWYTLTLNSAKPVEIEELRLVIPVKKEFAKWVNPFPFGKAENFCIPTEGWKAQEHKQIISVMNYDRGIEIVTEDNRGWSNAKIGMAQKIINTSDASQIIYSFVDKPTLLDGKKTFSFGIQAFPAKKPEINKATRKIVCLTPNVAAPISASTSRKDNKACISYPAKGNINPNRGTLEADIYMGFPIYGSYPAKIYQYYLSQYLFSIFDERHKLTLIWNPVDGTWVLSANKDKKSLYYMPGRKVTGVEQGWHRITLSWGKEIKIFFDGKLIASKKANGLDLGEDFSTDTASLIFGKDIRVFHSSFMISKVKITNDDSQPLGQFNKTPETLLLDDYTICKPEDKESHPVAGRPGKLSGSARFTKFNNSVLLQLDPIPQKFYFDHLKELGVETLVLSDFEYIGLPYPYVNEKIEFKSFIEEIRKRNFNMLLRCTYGVGFGCREDLLYGEYWYKLPISRWLTEGDPLGCNLFCAGCKFLTDYMLYNWEKTFNKWNLDGIYTDNTFQAGHYCNNQAHGCGWKDENGNLNASGNILAGRQFAKRLYAICKIGEKKLHHDLHGGGCSHAVYLSWADTYYSGEQYYMHKQEKNWNINLDQFAAQNRGELYGAGTHALPEMVPFGFEGMMAVAIQFGGISRTPIWWEWPLGVEWQMKVCDILDNTPAPDFKFYPYFRSPEFVNSDQEKREYASLYLNSGKKALLVISNLKWEKAQVKVKMNFKKMGLKGQIKDAVDSKPLMVNDNCIDIPMGAYQMGLFWIE